MPNVIKKSDYIVFWGIFLGYGFFAVLLISAYTPFHIIRSKYINKGIIAYWYQMRWNVYTKKVDDPVYQLYTIHKNKATLYDLRPFVPEYWFGLKRDYKIIAQEIMTVTNDTAAIRKMITYRIQLPANKNINDCISIDTLKFNAAVHANSVLLKGRYLMTSEEHLTWDKARKDKGNTKTIVVLPVNISDR